MFWIHEQVGKELLESCSHGISLNFVAVELRLIGCLCLQYKITTIELEGRKLSGIYVRLIFVTSEKSVVSVIRGYFR